MKFTRELPGTLTVRSIDEAGIRINDQVWSGPVAVTATEVIGEWTSAPVTELVAEDFEPLLEDSPELVLLGTGAKGQFAPRELMFAFARRGIGLEVMDTAAAARTFNVLAGDGRRVVAVLYHD